jgi:hypothetical protein
MSGKVEDSDKFKDDVEAARKVLEDIKSKILNFLRKDVKSINA